MVVARSATKLGTVCDAAIFIRTLIDLGQSFYMLPPIKRCEIKDMEVIFDEEYISCD